jgi:putative ABC transport system permease protein
MDNVMRDAKVGLRLLWKTPGFTAVAVLTLALGIAANTAIFSVIYATFFEPLPYRDADRLVMAWSRLEASREMVSARRFTAWKQHATVFEDLNAWTGRTASVSIGTRPEQLGVGPATPGFLPMLGYGHPLALGRDFLAEEGTPGRDQVVIVTHRIWSERFGSDPAIIGRQIRIDRRPYTVVGVLGDGPADTNMNQLWVPLSFTADDLRREYGALLVMGRLKPGVTIEQANANLAVLNQTVAKPASDANAWSASVEPFRNNFLSRDTKRGLWLLLGAVAFVLLIACANVANLLLARGTSRLRELAVRSSLGASRVQIVRQLLIESLVLAIAGGALGVALASGLLQIVIALMPPYMLPTEADVRLNVPVLLFTLSACAFAGILFGSAPAWQAARANANDTLKETGRTLTGRGHRLRRALVVTEFALALTLLAGGGVAIRSLLTLANRDLGFRTDHLLTYSLPMAIDRFSDGAENTAFYRQLIDRVQAVPGVLSASVSTGMPVLGQWGGMRFEIEGRPSAAPSEGRFAGFSMVSPEYFNTFDIRITRGRVFSEQDREGHVPVAIVNETFVNRYLPGVDPLNERLLFHRVAAGAAKPATPAVWQIVGVYADVRSQGPASEGFPEINVPFWQSPWPSTRMAVRTAVEPASVHQGIAAIVQSMDPDLPMADVKTMEQVVAESLVRDRFNTVLFGSFGLVGLLLAAIGIYGVMSCVVAQRTHEIGLRMALGAGRARILRHIVSEGMITAAIGTVFGSLGAFYAVRSMRGIVPGIDDMEPGAFVLVIATLLGAALVACVVPAAGAASVDPMRALREE